MPYQQFGKRDSKLFRQDSLGLGQIPLATGWTRHQYIGLHTKTAKEQSRTNEEEPLFLEVGECESDVWSQPSVCAGIWLYSSSAVSRSECQ